MNKAVSAEADLAASLKAVTFLKPDAGSHVIRLTGRQRELLLQMATHLRLPPRTIIYREDSPAEWVFIIGEGAVKSYRHLRSGKRLVSAFLFSRDLFGLAEQGRYVNTAQAITRVLIYRLPLHDLTVLLKIDGELQFKFLAKITHELREAQHRAVLINRRDAAGRLAMFLIGMLEHLDDAAARLGCVPLPMTRSDIAGFLGLSLESVSRAATELQRRELVSFETAHMARILDEAGLMKLSSAA